MDRPKKLPTTVYLDPRIAKAVKVKAALNERTVSDMVNDALARDLARDAKALEIFERRKHEKRYDYDEFIAQLKKDGLI